MNYQLPRRLSNPGKGRVGPQAAFGNPYATGFWNLSYGFRPLFTLLAACFFLLAGAALVRAQNVYFTNSQYVAMENGSYTSITIQRDNADTDMTVGYEITGSPTNSTQYLTTSGTVTFLAGDYEATIVPPEIQDNDWRDGDRTVSLVLTNADPGWTISPDLGIATLTIVDDDTYIPLRPTGTLQFAKARFITSEGDATVRITVTRDKAATGKILVDYIIGDPNDTAIAYDPAYNGVDYPVFDYYYQSNLYNFQTNTLTFNDFEMSKSFEIRLHDENVQFMLDNGLEITNLQNKEFTITLANPRISPDWPEHNLEAPKLGTPFRTKVELTDNDEGWSFSAMYYSHPAGAIPHPVIGVKLPPRQICRHDTVSIRWRILVSRNEGADNFDLTAGGPAGAGNGSDYSEVDQDFPASTVSGILTLASNVYVTNFTVETLGIKGVEFNKDIRIVLYNPTGHFFDPNYRSTNDAFVGRVGSTILTTFFHTGNGGPEPAGAVDTAWNPDSVSYTRPPYNPSPGANMPVYAVLVQPDQKLLLGGNFTAVNTDPWYRIARLMPNGSSDTSFTAGNGADGFVDAIAIYPTDTNSVNNEKIIIGGGFTSINNTTHTRYGVARLNTNGTLDTTFNPGTGVDMDEFGVVRPVRAVAVQPDGKVLIAGEFTRFNGFTRQRIARLNANGSVDTGFMGGTATDLGANNTIWAIALMTNGAIVIGGDFTMVNGEIRSGIARLNSDGSLDTTFDPGSGTDGPVYTLAVQPDQKILVGGDFSQINLLSRNCIARFNNNGLLDTSFDPGTGADGAINGLALQPDGNILAVGAFRSYNDTRRIGVTRIHPDGVIDTSFLDTAYNQYAGLYNRLEDVGIAVAVNATGEVYVGGSFMQLGGGYNRLDFHPRANIARLVGGTFGGPGYVQFDAAEYRADEYGSSVYTIIARLDGILGPIDVTGQTVNGLAQVGLDYTPTSDIAAWGNHPAGTWYESIGMAGSRLISVGITDDSDIEGNETFGIELVPPFQTLPLGGDLIPLGVGLGRRHSTCTIVDDDFKRGEFSFSSPTYSVNEAGGQAVITVLRKNGTASAVTVAYATSPFGNISPATPGSNYVSKSGTLNFADGQSSQTIRITILDTTSVEPDKFFQIRLSNPQGGASMATPSNCVVTIVDNDYKPGRISFITTNYVADEVDPYATITVQRTGGNQGQVSVDYATLVDTAAPGINYSNVSGTLIWNDGDSSNKTFRIPLVQNGLVENQRMVALSLSNFQPTNENGPLPGTIINSKLTINDDDHYGALQFSAYDYFADEIGAGAIITVVRQDGIAGTIHVDYATKDESARSGVNYSNVAGTLTFEPGQLSASFMVPIQDDHTNISQLRAKLVLLNPTDGASLGTRTEAYLNIVDRESENIPAGGMDPTFRIGTGPNGIVYALAQEFLPNGLGSSNRYLLMGGEFTSVDSSPRNRFARLLDDGSVDPAFGTLGGANGAINTIAVQASDQKVIIGGAFSTINGTNRNNIARLNTDSSIDLFYNPGTGADNPVNAIVLQKSGSTQKAIVGGSFASINGISRNSVARLNDNGSVDSTFNIGTGANGPVYALAVQEFDWKILVGGNFNQWNGTTNYSILRLNTNGTLDVTFNPGSGPNSSVRAIAVQADGYSVLGGYFTSFNGTPACRIVRLDPFGQIDNNFMAQVGSGANGPVFSISIQADGKLVIAGEFTTFNGITRHRLTRLNPDGSVDPTINFGNGANDYIAATTVQNDRKIIIGGAFTNYDGHTANHLARLHGGSLTGSGTFQFSMGDYRVIEGTNQMLIDVWRTGGTFGLTTVHFSTGGGTALAGVDYFATNYDLVFAEGETRQTVTLAIVDDTLVEDDETVELTLSNPSDGATLGAQPSATLTIVNDDSRICFGFPTYSITENFPTTYASISVVRTGALSTAVSVDYWTSPGTAQPNVDYTPTSGTLTFGEDDTEEAFNIHLIVNPAITENLTVNLHLGNLQGHGSIIAPSNAVLTILENDTAPGVVSLARAAYQISESGTNLVVSVLRTNGHTGSVTVQYATGNITATDGVDYFGGSGTLSFGEGETVKTIPINIQSDTLVEGNETFEITLSNATGGLLLGALTHATVTITDDDFGPGSLDTSFDPGTGANSFVSALALQPDGRILLGGAFTSFRGSTFNYIARLRTNGLLDPAFLPGAGGNGTVNSIMLETNGNIVLSGAFTTFNYSNRAHVVRLNSNGAVDPNLTYNTGLNAVTFGAIGLTDGKLLVGGAFSAPPKSGLVRLFVNGQADTGFDPGFGVSGGIVNTMLMDGSQVVIGGSFSMVDVVNRSRVARLGSDGQVDLNFVPPTMDGPVFAMVLQPDRKLIVAGSFTNVLGQARSRIARLNSDGSLDTTFAPADIPSGIIYALALQADGKILAGGSFDHINGYTRNRIARFRSNGTLDLVFDPGLGANNAIYAIVVQPDGRPVIGGAFTTVNGFSRKGIARLNGDFTTEMRITTSFVDGKLTLVWPAQTGRVYNLYYSTDLSTDMKNWNLLRTYTAVGDSLQYIEEDTQNPSYRFYRVQMEP